MAEKQYRKVRILIASPSDVENEREYALEVVRDWNTRNSDERELVLDAVLWESHSAPEAGDRIQGILNKQIVDTCDGVIGVFWTRIGTDTGMASGGAVEEIKRLEGMGKPVMLYFSLDKLPHDVDIDQLQKVRAFKAERQCKGDLLGEYEDPNDFRKQLTHHLGIQVRRWFLGEKEADTDTQSDPNNYQLEQRYQSTLKEELGKIRLLGSPDIDGVQVKLDDTFVPLRISHMWRAEKRFDKTQHSVKQEETHCHTPDGLMQKVFPKYRTLLVIGDPGSGKTTLMKYYAMCCLENKPERLFGDNKSTRVFYLPLRELSLDEQEQYYALHVQLALWAKKHAHSIEEKVFENWLCDTKFRNLVLLDGLDEISDLEKRKRVCGWIDRACNGFTSTFFVVTSRFTGYRKTDGVELTADHIRADVMDFTPEQQKEFLLKWFTAALQRELCPVHMANEEWLKSQKKKADERTRKIVEYLQRPENKGMRELAAVPMMLQIMAILFKERDFLPGTRVDLYNATLNYLLEFRDQRRNLKPLLSAKNARLVLAPVSLWMQETLKADDIARDAMHSEMQKLLKTLDNPPVPENFCRNLVDRAGLLAEYGDDDYLFRHKTFREYLAGTQLIKKILRTSGHVDTLVQHFGDDWWNEPLIFFMGQADEEMFDLFMEKLFDSPMSEELSPKQLALLKILIEEAPQKKIDALSMKLLNSNTTTNSQRYIIDCLKAIRKTDALKVLRNFQKQDLAKNQDIKNRTEDVIGSLLMVLLDESERGALIRDKIKNAKYPLKDRPVSFRNPFEHNAQYILIRKGKYVYSATENDVAVDDGLYVAKYQVTNRQYRSFIDFLAEKPTENNTNLSLKAYQEALHDLAQSRDGSVKGLSEYLKQESDLVKLFGSRYDNKWFNKDDQPVVMASWYAARSYCLWLSMLAGDVMVYRLPDENEWEWAAGGKRDRVEGVLKVRKYPWGDKPEPTAKFANYNSNENLTTPVGSYPDGATPEGLYDMAGNVWEWMENWSDNRHKYKALRGGSWDNISEDLRCSSRYLAYPVSRGNLIGFRVVRSSLS